VGVCLLASFYLEGLLSVFLQSLTTSMRATPETLLASTLLVRLLLPFLLGCLFVALVSFLCLRALGVQVQRAAVAELTFPPSRGWGYLRLLRPALMFSLGFETGLTLSPAVALLLLAPRVLPWIAVWLMAFTLLNWSWLAFLHAGSRLLMGAKVGPRPPIWTQRLLLTATAALMVVLYGSALLIRLLIVVSPHVSGPLPEGIAGIDAQAFFVVLLFVPALLSFFLAFAFSLLWGFLLLVAAAFRLRRRLRCPACGEPSPHRKALGHFCDACDEPLAGWAYTRKVTA